LHDHTVKSLMNKNRLGHLAILVLVFLVAFLPRAVYPVSRSILWYQRAVRFSDALLAKDWAGTCHTYHPGVTTMWIAGLGISLFARRRGLTSAQLLGDQPARPGDVNDAIEAGVIPLAVVIALCIALTYVLLKRLTNRNVALAGSLLLALDPFHLTHSKVLHVDGLLAVFMFVSVLFLFNHLRRPSKLDLALSGAFAGLAFLTKTPSWFLVPYAVLAVGTYEWPSGSESLRVRWAVLRRVLWRIIRTFLIWGAVAAVLFVVLWPAMWVEPLEMLRFMGHWTVFHTEEVHENPVYFNGESSFEDPGLAFYLATIAWKTTVLTLPMALVAPLFALLGLYEQRQKRLVWLLVGYALFFTVQMGLSAHKELRYVLPIFPALDVLAAFGLVQILEVIGRMDLFQSRGWLRPALLAVALGLHGGVALAHHPYYGTHHNSLLGGSKAAKKVLPIQNQAEGLDLAARYLNQLPRASQARAMVHPLGARLFERSFLGYTSPGPEQWTNYRVYYVNQVMRGLGGEEWEEAWRADKQETPLWTVTFSGVPYVWVYGSPPGKPAAGGPEYELDYRLGEHIRLERYRLSSETLHPGDTLTVVLLWETDAELQDNYSVFCHLLSANGDLVAQRDGPPIYGVRPTPSWRAGEVIEDSRDIFLSDTIPSGEYELSVGMYDLETMQRLPARTSAGERLPADRIVLGTVHVQTNGTPNK
jgi:hypothetical protein